MSRTEQLESLYAKAVALRSHEERSRFLESVCVGDAELRQQLDRLLLDYADSSPGAQLAGSPPGFLGCFEQPGDWVGSFRLIRRLGEGGFGVVFEAEQMKPFRRTVALKVLKAGLDTERLLRRFAQEQQTLAMMDHPHIARVLEAGATSSGRPFFVMEIASGNPVTMYCDQKRISIAGRVQLLIQVCRAVHHAHQKGVIHRDLKPTNILVEDRESGPSPKIIDFGIAKIVHQKTAGETALTDNRQFIGTPAYASPEQIRSEVTNVDTRSDVYSLGIILYELLLGTTPTAAGTSERASSRRERMRESSIAWPSSVLRQMPGEEAARLAALRNGNVAGWLSEISRDLDWIVLKATDADPAGRYESTEALARDLERYLQHQPVEARKPSWSYVTGRFVRRHRWLVASACLIALALAVGASAATWGWWIARREARIANIQSQTARQLNDILFSALLRADPGQGTGRDVSVRDLLGDLSRQVDDDRNLTPEAECSLHDMLSFIYRQTGEYDLALRHAKRGLELSRKLGDDPRRLASFLMTLGEVCKELDRFAEASAYLEECVETRRRIFGDDHPQVIRTMLTLGRVQYQSGDHTKGLALVADALARARLQRDEPGGKEQLIRCFNMMELLLQDEKRFEEAIELNHERLELTRHLWGDDNPETLLAKAHRGDLLKETGRLDEAREILSTTLKQAREGLGDGYPFTLETMISLADCLARCGETDAAAGLYDEAIDLAETKFAFGYPDRIKWMRQAARFYETNGLDGRAETLRSKLDQLAGIN